MFLGLLELWEFIKEEFIDNEDKVRTIEQIILLTCRHKEYCIKIFYFRFMDLYLFTYG